MNCLQIEKAEERRRWHWGGSCRVPKTGIERSNQSQIIAIFARETNTRPSLFYSRTVLKGRGWLHSKGPALNSGIATRLERAVWRQYGMDLFQKPVEECEEFGLEEDDLDEEECNKQRVAQLPKEGQQSHSLPTASYSFLRIHRRTTFKLTFSTVSLLSCGNLAHNRCNVEKFKKIFEDYPTHGPNLDLAPSNVNASSTFNTAQELPILNITTLLTLNADVGPTSAYIHAYLWLSPLPVQPIHACPEKLVIQEKFVKQFQMYAQNHSGNISESTISPSSTPYPPTYNPWAYWHTQLTNLSRFLHLWPVYGENPIHRYFVPTVQHRKQNLFGTRLHMWIVPNVGKQVRTVYLGRRNGFAVYVEGNWANGNVPSVPIPISIPIVDDSSLAEWTDEDEEEDQEDFLEIEYHPTCISNVAKCRRCWETRWEALLQAAVALLELVPMLVYGTKKGKRRRMCSRGNCSYTLLRRIMTRNRYRILFNVRIGSRITRMSPYNMPWFMLSWLYIIFSWSLTGLEAQFKKVGKDAGDGKKRVEMTRKGLADAQKLLAACRSSGLKSAIYPSNATALETGLVDLISSITFLLGSTDPKSKVELVESLASNLILPLAATQTPSTTGTPTPSPYALTPCTTSPPGTEITISYGDILASVAECAKYLAPYGIHSDPTRAKISEKRRESLRKPLTLFPPPKPIMPRDKWIQPKSSLR
ncbi:hypothetical protein BT96DRAFT_1084477 [Gymnopus androsaceus JB14]|uniref:Uncharacterized protein n=1 Tax=Gymnopus androsaceus JB14 TaxID=1447944 RepID=A0A6A4GMP5_9AGAR|nr:hypothetical protein BT96DRAFT_1084477 [Gymnopus androsaceus JB14]